MPIITVTGPNIPCQIHAAGCADLKRGVLRRAPEEHWTVEVENLHQLAVEIWGDPASDNLEVGSQEWHETCDEWLHAEYRMMPCAPEIPPGEDTWSSASRQHFIDTGRYLAIGEAVQA